MDRRLDPQSRFNRDRRSAAGPRLATLLTRQRSASFDELLDAADPAGVDDVSAWLGCTLASGLVEHVPADGSGPSRFRLLRPLAQDDDRRKGG